MRTTLVPFILLTILLLKCSAADFEKGNFGFFLSKEIEKFAGKTNGLAAQSMKAKWRTKRDELGAAVDAQVDFPALTNLLSKEFGPPRLYISDSPPTYQYPWTAAGVSIFVKNTFTNVQITITKPIR